MNYQKLDAALAMALNDVSDLEASTLDIFIHTEPVLDAEAVAVLENLGISVASSGKDVFTAKLPPNAIAHLSQQPWVKHLKLSQQLRFAKPSFIPRSAM
ncbi:MAG: hypothetical protein KME23_16080 [Goleter apudmare HA4340-LM2]|jgi:hypothetical protein|nr:hypothetical protein [Goleter apudmare HA4340-LM2]